MRVNLDKSLDEDVFDTIRITNRYPVKSAWNIISYVNLCKLPQITKNDNCGQVVPLFGRKLK